MSPAKPTIYLSNWSSHRTPGHHGPGRKLTIMISPRHWEEGEGSVPWLTPSFDDLRAVRCARISPQEYRRRFEAALAVHASRGNLAPGELAVAAPESGYGVVEDGDTLCCACSRDEAAAGRCHRAWAAPALVAAGWRVVLDGQELEVSDG